MVAVSSAVIKKVAIVGGGPAGLMAAATLRRLGALEISL